MKKENTSSDNLSENAFGNFSSDSQHQDNQPAPFGGGHAFRAIQQHNHQQINTNFAAYLQSLQQNASNFFNPIQNHSNSQIQPSMHSCSISSSVPHNCSNSQNGSTMQPPVSCSTEMIISLFEIVQKQTLALEKLNRKVEEVVQKNSELKNKIQILQEQKKHHLGMGNCHEKKNFYAVKEAPEIGVPNRDISQTLIEGQSVTSADLVKILFGNHKYEYNLRLSKPMDETLFRQRNFSLNIQLVDQSGNRVENSNKIPMSLAIYTCENPPKFIEKNTAGQKMLKGYVDQSLLNGVCKFEKVQVREVTSHYRGGWVFFVVIPCMPPLGGVKNEKFIEFTKIKPLVIDQVVVKAKKPKKKDHEKEEKQNEGSQKKEVQAEKVKPHDSGSEQWEQD